MLIPFLISVRNAQALTHANEDMNEDKRKWRVPKHSPFLLGFITLFERSLAMLR